MFDVEVFWDPLPSREEPASVEPDSVVACDDRRKVCVAPFARRDQSPPESVRAEFALLAAAAEAKVEGAMLSLESGC